MSLEVGGVEPGKVAQPEKVIAKSTPTDTKTKRQAIKIEGKLEADALSGVMIKAAAKRGEKELPVARKILGSPEDKKLLERANAQLQKGLPPSKEARELLNRVKGIELAQNKKGEYVITMKMLDTFRAKDILVAIGKSLEDTPSLVRSEVANLLRTNSSFKKIIAERMEQQVKDYEAHQNESIKIFGYNPRSDTPRQIAEKKESMLLEEHSDYTNMQKAKQCIQLIDESSGKLKLVGSKFELNYDMAAKPHQDTINHLLALCPDVRDLLPLILASPVLTPALNSKEFWATDVGKEILQHNESNLFVVGTPTSQALQLLEVCGDTLKITTFTSGSRIYMRFEPKETGEESVQLQTMLHMFKNGEKDLSSKENKELLHLMNENRVIGRACEKAGFGSFQQLNEAIGSAVSLMKDAIQSQAQERIDFFKDFLKTEEGKDWGASFCTQADNQALFVANSTLVGVEKTHGEPEPSFALTLSIDPKWGYPREDGGIKTFNPPQHELTAAATRPATIRIEIPGNLASTDDAALVLFDFMRLRTSYEPVFLSPERKVWDENLTKVYEGIVPTLSDLKKRVGEYTQAFFTIMDSDVKLSEIQSLPDKTASVTVEITPRWRFDYHWDESPSKMDQTRFPTQKVSFVLQDMPPGDWSWDNLEVSLRESVRNSQDAL